VHRSIIAVLFIIHEIGGTSGGNFRGNTQGIFRRKAAHARYKDLQYILTQISLKYYRWNIQMPTIIKGSISILSDAGLGMAMFSLGTALTFCCLFITNLYLYLGLLPQELLTVTYAINPGLFMALQPKIISCGKSVATFAMAVRFLTGPAVIAATSIAVGLRGVLLHVAIVQVSKGIKYKLYNI
jgi:hypothetical protein